MKYFLVALLICLSIYIGYVLYDNTPVSYIQKSDSLKEISAQEDKYSKILSKMTLEEKVGQLFIIGHWEYVDFKQTEYLIHEHHIGGVIIMSSPDNIANNIPAWTSAWQSTSTYPLTIAIDQEGGAVTRLKSSEYVQKAQPDILSVEEAFTVGEKRGKELYALGINTNFAPVLETSVNPDAFLYNRVFRTPKDIVSFGSAMIRGMRKGGIIAVPKHFPGHEDTPADSHTELPILKVTADEFDIFVQSFTDTIQQATPSAIMTAHVQVPSLDSVYPATLSYTILTGKLRESIGFTGVIITDDMVMQSVTNTWTSDEASLLSLKAGADMVLFAAKPQDAISAIEHIITAVQNNELSEERIDESLRRILQMKEQYR